MVIDVFSYSRAKAMFGVKYGYYFTLEVWPFFQLSSGATAASGNS